MSLSNEEQQAVKLYHQILRLGPKPDYTRKLERLLKNQPGQPVDRPKQMLYAAQMYFNSYKYEDGDTKNRASFHTYLGILQMLNLTQFMSPLWLHWNEGKDFSNERAKFDELTDIAHSAVNSDDYRKFDLYQDFIADDLKDVDQVVQFQCPSGWIVDFKGRSYIIKRQIKNCNMLFKNVETRDDKNLKNAISSDLAIWKDVKLEVARFVEIDEDGEFEVKDSPTYVIPTFGTDAETSLRRYERNFSHAAKSQFLLYSHKDEKKKLTREIKAKEKSWKESVEEDLLNSEDMKRDFKRLYAFYKEKAGDTSTATPRKENQDRRMRDGHIIVEEDIS
jgi:hypothetical protein